MASFLPYMQTYFEIKSSFVHLLNENVEENIEKQSQRRDYSYIPDSQLLYRGMSSTVYNTIFADNVNNGMLGYIF